MTSGIGNPDWQRRYNFSAQPLARFTFTDGVSFQTSVVDTNGFPNLLAGIDGPSTSAMNQFVIQWWQDAAMTIFIGNSAVVPTPNSSMVQRFPTMSRYCNFLWNYKSGAGASSWKVSIFGTTEGNDNTMTQNTDVASIIVSATVGAGATVTTMASGTFGGPALFQCSHANNNAWDSWLEYYDVNLLAWTQFWIVKGADKNALAWTERIYLPFAPVRMNVRNRDTVAQVMNATLVNGI